MRSLSARLPAGRITTLRVRLGARLARIARRALRDDARVRVALRLRATGPGGQSARRSLTVTFVP